MKEDLEGEIWKDIVGYDGSYQISNMGRIYALPREWHTGKSNALVSHGGKILSQSTSKKGYKRVNLCVGAVRSRRLIHQLVAETFLNHVVGKTLVVDHINDNPTDNRLDNLQLITIRSNSRKTKDGKHKYSSKFRGVCFYKPLGKWQAGINLNGKTKHLGRFNCEFKAHLAYRKALKEYELSEA